MGLLLATISMAGRDFVSSSRNLGAKSGLKKFNICSECLALRNARI
jgi:hypothetical protein